MQADPIHKPIHPVPHPCAFFLAQGWDALSLIENRTNREYLAPKIKEALSSFLVSHPFARKKAKGWSTALGSLTLAALLCLTGCRTTPRDSGTVVFLIESSPANLDPRIGTDAQSEHIDELLFDGLVARDASFHFTPALAERWEQPNPLTLVFHLRNGVRFHDGRTLTARDVKWTLDSMISGKIISP